MRAWYRRSDKYRIRQIVSHLSDEYFHPTATTHTGRFLPSDVCTSCTLVMQYLGFPSKCMLRALYPDFWGIFKHGHKGGKKEENTVARRYGLYTEKEVWTQTKTKAWSVGAWMAPRMRKTWSLSWARFQHPTTHMCASPSVLHLWSHDAVSHVMTGRDILPDCRVSSQRYRIRQVGPKLTGTQLWSD